MHFFLLLSLFLEFVYLQEPSGLFKLYISRPGPSQLMLTDVAKRKKERKRTLRARILL